MLTGIFDRKKLYYNLHKLQSEEKKLQCRRILINIAKIEITLSFKNVKSGALCVKGKGFRVVN